MHIVARGLFGVALWTAASAGAGATNAVEEVIAAERAFAADTREAGFKRGFLAHAAPDAFVFRPGPVPARPGLEKLPDEPPPGPPLFWWPEYAGAARSGDLGFTTGGATIPVRYFTVWRRQPDGGWKWIYDGGPALRAVLPDRSEAPVQRLAPATAAAGSANAAERELRPIEAALAVPGGIGEALRPLLLSEALVAGAPDPGDRDAELASRPEANAVRPLGLVASAAGDMAFAWGEVHWERQGVPRLGHYARIWQKRTEGWRIAADILIAAPPAPPPPPPG